MKKTLEKAASHGRFGDDRLLHVSQAEIEGLASLIPGGKLPTNPKTGLPEAFFFLPFLAGLGAMAAPAAAAAGTAATAGLAAAAAPAAAGLAAAAAPAAAAGTAATAGLTAAAAPVASGLAAGGGMLAPTAASAIPQALTSGIGAQMAATAPGAATSLGGLTQTASLGAMGPSAIPSVAAVPGSATGLGGLTQTASLGAMGPSAIPSVAAVPGAATSGISSLPAASGAPGSLFGSTMSSPGVASSLPSAAPAASSAPAAAPAATTSAGITTPGLPFPPAPAAPGASSGIGSLFGNMDMGKMLQYGAIGSMLLPQMGGGGKGDDDDDSSGSNAKNYDRGDQSAPEDDGNSGGIASEFNYFPKARYYAEGGLASLGGGAKGDIGDEELIDATVAAVQGQSPNANAILNMFVERFGQDALKDLMVKIQGQAQHSNGLNDAVPATISSNGMQAPAQLSEGEYVVPSDVVSGLGNGSTEAGAKQLEGMVDRTREIKGLPKDPKQMDPLSALPV